MALALVESQLEFRKNLRPVSVQARKIYIFAKASNYCDQLYADRNQDDICFVIHIICKCLFFPSMAHSLCPPFPVALTFKNASRDGIKGYISFLVAADFTSQHILAHQESCFFVSPEMNQFEFTNVVFEF